MSKVERGVSQMELRPTFCVSLFFFFRLIFDFFFGGAKLWFKNFKAVKFRKKKLKQSRSNIPAVIAYPSHFLVLSKREAQAVSTKRLYPWTVLSTWPSGPNPIHPLHSRSSPLPLPTPHSYYLSLLQLSSLHVHDISETLLGGKKKRKMHSNTIAEFHTWTTILCPQKDCQ